VPAEKTARASERRRIAKRRVRSSSRTAVKKAVAALSRSDVDTSATTVASAVSAIDRALTKGIIHRNNAARRKSRLMKRLNAVTAAAAG
jgi:small subunit ribosomal protein S20